MVTAEQGWMIAGLAAIMFAASPANADPRMDVTTLSEDESLADLSGDWSFTTDRYRSGQCVMTGSLYVYAPTTDDTGYQCTLTSVETCGAERSIVEQTCTMSSVRGGLLIASQIQSFIQEKPSSIGYLPDNFILTDVTADEMSGELRSAVTSPVLFVRTEGTIS